LACAAALDIGRNHVNIITSTDLPPDLDNVIQAVRNNLIHLSGDAMRQEVSRDSSGHPILLEAFLKDNNRVFDAIWTIGEAINGIYEKIANGTL
jgi:hypothetical protein